MDSSGAERQTGESFLLPLSAGYASKLELPAAMLRVVDATSPVARIDSHCNLSSFT